VGATKRDVLVQFLIEAATVSALGGVIGIAFGVGGTTVVTIVQKLPPTLVWMALASAAAMSVTVGVIFGLHPAWKASNVDPIAALRS
jgi:putative ABC transport system permease protein